MWFFHKVNVLNDPFPPHHFPFHFFFSFFICVFLLDLPKNCMNEKENEKFQAQKKNYNKAVGNGLVLAFGFFCMEARLFEYEGI